MSVTPATIRPATPEDLKAVADIYAHYVTHTVITFDEQPLTIADWERRIDAFADRGLPFLVAETPGGAAGEVAGYAYAGPWRPKPAYRHTVEDTIYLAPDQTGRGLGSALLGELLTRCGQAGVRQVIAVIADPGSEASASLHRRFGFTSAGRLGEVGFKHGRWVDTLLMQRTLDPEPNADPKAELKAGPTE